MFLTATLKELESLVQHSVRPINARDHHFYIGKPGELLSLLKKAPSLRQLLQSAGVVTANLLQVARLKQHPTEQRRSNAIPNLPDRCQYLQCLLKLTNDLERSGPENSTLDTVFQHIQVRKGLIESSRRFRNKIATTPLIKKRQPKENHSAKTGLGIGIRPKVAFRKRCPLFCVARASDVSRHTSGEKSGISEKERAKV
jgi:hypothetical protein